MKQTTNISKQKKSINLILKIAILLIFTVLFCGCNPTLSVNIASTDAVSLEFYSGLGESVEETVSAITGTDAQTPLFDKEAVSQNLEATGFSVKSVEVYDNNLFLETNPMSMYKIQSITSGLIEEITSNSVTISLTPEKFQEFVTVLPEETVGYLDLLCAPIFTNEELTTEDYYEVLSAIYGKTLAQEAMESEFVINVSVPSNEEIIDIKVDIPNAKALIKNNSAKIVVPLADFLCNLRESMIIIVW